MTMSAEERRMSAAIEGAMRNPRRPFVAYDEADRQAARMEAAKLRRQSEILVASVEQDDANAE